MHSKKEYANGIVNVSSITVNTQKQSVRIIMGKKFIDVNKYNLQVYSKTFQFIHNKIEEQRQNKSREKVHGNSLLSVDETFRNKSELNYISDAEDIINTINMKIS